jgi:uracil-DNA glycosylase
MNPFQNALELVHETLTHLHKDGVELRASVAALRQLQLSRPSSEAASLISSRIEEPPAAALSSRAPAPVEVSVSPVNAPRPPVPVAKAPVVMAPVVMAPVIARTFAPINGSKAEALEAMRSSVSGCALCAQLAATRTQVVFGIGNPDAELLFIGDSPDEEDDQQGAPLVGKAGELLTKIIETMGLPLGEVYLAHVLKCRPDTLAGEARKPRGEEMARCLPYLKQQIEIIQPKVLVALGASAMEGLLGETQPMARLRGRWHQFEGIPLMATYHPAYLLRNQALAEKRKVWEDMLMVLEQLARPISTKQRAYFLPKA